MAAATKLVSVSSAAKGVSATLGRWMNEVPPLARLAVLVFRMMGIVAEHGAKVAAAIESFCAEEGAKMAAARPAPTDPPEETA